MGYCLENVFLNACFSHGTAKAQWAILMSLRPQ